MEWSDFRDKKIGLLGAGKENLSLIPHLEKAGAHITLCDQSPLENQKNLSDSIELKSGPNYLQDLGRFDYIFRSPGLPVEQVTTALNGLERQPIRTSAMDLFLALRIGRTIGVTGTKGKGTTSTMIESILKEAGQHVMVVGNIGAVVFDRLNEITPETFVVIELSSFQLEDINRSPDIAVLLAITTNDHLQPLSERSPNFHPTVEDYAAAKAQITKHQESNQTLVFVGDSLLTKKIATETAAKTIEVSWNNPAAEIVVSQETITTPNGLIDCKKAGLKGDHIITNAAVAAGVAVVLDVDPSVIEDGLANYRPLPHRLEPVLETAGVLYVDDSYATNPEATIAALTAFDKPIIWIGGGSSKGAEFSELAKKLGSKKIKMAILIGQEAPAITAALQQQAPEVPVERLNSLGEAVGLAKSRAVEGDVVLLSPACASKDMFRDAAERGDLFKQLVRQ